MADPSSASVSEILQALADLAPSAEQRSTGLTIPTEWFRWLPIDALRLFYLGPYPGSVEGERPTISPWFSANAPEVRAVLIDRQFGERLAAVDQVRADRSLRVGWLFVAGRMTREDGKISRVFHPLVRVPVRVERPLAVGRVRLVPAGDVEISELVTDTQRRDELERHIEFGGGALSGGEPDIPAALLGRLDRLRHYAGSLAHGAGLPASRLVSALDGPDGFMRSEHLVIVAGVGVYATHETAESSRASSLRAWAAGRLDRWTAFHSLYLEPPATAPLPARPSVESPSLLTPVQRQAVAASRLAPLTLIAGAPGTGKSHTIAAIACDAVANGERVLVAAKTDASVDALLDLLERAPGPDPVVFGSNERREALASRLSGGQLQPVGNRTLAAARLSFDASLLRRTKCHQYLADRLGAEAILDDSGPGIRGNTDRRSAAPGLFEADADLDHVETLLAATAEGSTGWLARRHRRQARQLLVACARASPDLANEELAAAAAEARLVQAAAALRGEGGLELGTHWTELLEADDQTRRTRGQWLAALSRSEDRLSYSALSAVAALATALRSGRSARRTQLARLDDDKLTRALPLWVGTLADVDDLLPPVAGLFDLVILDEASSIDQPLAATALLRGRRAVIAGDPRQLRQVSFVSDARLHEVVATYGLDRFPVLAARLDIRRNSTFDLAAGAAPVLVLDEHFRSDPHLVDFVARRLYEGKLHIATRSPATESKDCVDVVRVTGRRDDAGVVEAEVARTVFELKALRRVGRTSVGVVTPFRAQADAIEKAVLEAFSADDLEALDLRVGTAHAFQGNERDLVVVSLGVGPESSAASWRFVEDPHLFTVLMTRARRRMTILLSADPPEGGLMAAYLAQADCPPGAPKPVCPTGPWARAIADDLVAAGIPIFTSYPTGRHVVDLCSGDERGNIDIECQVHQDGPDAHIERRLALSRSGWEFVEAYPSRWRDRRAELVVELIGRLRKPDM